MKLLLSVAAVLASVGFGEAADNTNLCFLLNGAASAKPFPSLTQCYKNNQDSCCVSAHDASIQSSYGGLLSETCLREYQDLEHYFCLGCNPEMAKYIQWYNKTTVGGATVFNKYDSTYAEACDVGDNACVKLAAHKNNKYGMIKICPGFKDKLMYESTDSKTKIDKYDNCGLNLPTHGSSSIGWLPSAHFKGDVYKFLDEIRPPYFETSFFDISIESDSALKTNPKPGRAMTKDGVAFNLDKWTGSECFQAASSASVSFAVLAVVTFLSTYVL